MQITTITISLFIILAALPGCIGHTIITKGTTPRAYPYDLPTLKVVDIQVRRDGTDIQITNTTADSYTDFDLWLNERFVHHVPSLKAGQTIRLSLYEFVDEHKEGLKVGGILATGRPDPIIKAEIEAPTGMIGLIAVADR